ncbi:hypothetical protein ACFVAV_12920 [Nocardia sp. NPDC057663]
MIAAAARARPRIHVDYDTIAEIPGKRRHPPATPGELTEPVTHQRAGAQI